MTPVATTRVLSRLGVASLAAAALVASGASLGAAAAPSRIDVTVGDIASARPASGGWFFDKAGAASFEVTKDGPGNDLAMRLGVTEESDKVYLYDAFGAGSRPHDIPALLTGASYDYAGTNVNLQLEVIFKPNNGKLYGPSGTSKACTPASTWYGWGLTNDPEWCYTVLKWEPYVRPGVASWTHVDLSVDRAAQSSTSTGGWVSSKNLGQYPGNVSNGQLMSSYLGQVADYEVTAFAFGIGSGTPGPQTYGYLKSFTLGGTTYGFAPTAAVPAPVPAADTDALLDLIDSASVDVAADTASFGVPGADLAQLDVSSPFDAVFSDWSDPSDTFVDVYAYSTATFLGSFPVVGGSVVLTGLDLSGLAPGSHHLLLRGQGSGAIAVVAFTARAAAGGPGTGLAATGADPLLPVSAALLLLLAGAALVGLRARRRA